MSRFAYVNGYYVPHHHGSIHIEDRGYQFADGIYEVVSLYQNYFLDEEKHLKRLLRSLQEIKLALPYSLESLRFIIREIRERNNLENGLIYIQVTRGSAPRAHSFPKKSCPSLIITARHLAYPQDISLLKGLTIMTVPEKRWARCDIKSVGLLPNILAKQEALEKGYEDAWFITPEKERIITEATSSNAWIIDQRGILRTHPASESILNGITRDTLINIIQCYHLPFDEKAFSYDELLQAQEVFSTSATTFVQPILCVDGHYFEKRKNWTHKLYHLYLEQVKKS